MEIYAKSQKSSNHQSYNPEFYLDVASSSVSPSKNSKASNIELAKQIIANQQSGSGTAKSSNTGGTGISESLTKPKMRFKIGNYVMEHVKDDLIGQIIRHRYLFIKYVDEGSYGKIYEIMDLKNPREPLVAKISQHHQNFETEYNALNIIYEVNKGFQELQSDCEDMDQVSLLRPIKAGLLF